VQGVQPYRELITAMVRTGVVGYGGGPAIIPLIRHEAVTRYHWIEDEEFGEILALANALPGPIATKMAAYLGYRKQGWTGAVIAVLSHILPSILTMIGLLGALYVLRKSPIVKGMIAAVDPVIVVMLGIMAYEFAEKTWRGMGKLLGTVFGVIAFVLLEVLHVSSGLVVILYLAYGAIHLQLMSKWKRKSTGDKGGLS
jgi:chromate transporter